MHVPTWGRALANAFALGALPLWWYLDPAQSLDASPGGRDAWEARVAAAWHRVAEAVTVPTLPPSGHDQTGVLADGTTFPAGISAYEAMVSSYALRACGFVEGSEFGFALLVRSDAARNLAVVRSGRTERDACAERALAELPLADLAPPGGAVVASGTASVRAPRDGALTDAERQDAWDSATHEVGFWHPEATSNTCYVDGRSAPCRALRAAAPSLRACGLAADDRFGFASRLRSEGAGVEVVVNVPDDSRLACVQDALERAFSTDPDVRAGAVLYGFFDVRGLEAPEGASLWRENRPASGYAALSGNRGGAVGIVIDEALVAGVHDQVACPSERVGTQLDLDWRDGTFTARTDPEIPCVEANAHARSSVLLDLVTAAVDRSDPQFDAMVADAGPPSAWPQRSLELWIVLPELGEVAP